MDPRPYQLAAEEAIFAEWEAGRRRTLLVLPTGTGKTIVFCRVSKEVVRRGGRVLILAHRGELLDQAADKMHASTGLACAVEKAQQTSLGQWERIVVGSVQSMMRPKRLARFKPDHFDLIIVDEAHHALADTYQRIFEHFDQACVLGVTATPDRGDKQNLGTFFDSLAYEYSLPEAIRDGYLSQIKAMTIPLELDLTQVKQQAGDYQLKALGTALDPYLEQIADEIATRCADRKTVVFLPLIATAQKFRTFLQMRGVKAAEVNGESVDRKQILDDFNANKFNVLCNAMLLTEGWDCPPVDCIVVLRPTKVRSLYCQMVGRGTRIFPGKDHLLLLDFLWHTSRHELCRPADLICDSPDVAAKVAENLAEMPGCAMDLDAAVEAGTDEVIVEREEALAKQLAEQRRKKGKLVNPLQYEMSIGAEDLADYRPAFGWEMGPASDAQLAAIENAGVDPAVITNAGLASKLLDRIAKRRKLGLATPKQIRLLEKKGFQHVGRWDFGSASNMITRIASSGWRVPAGVEAANYRPQAEPAIEF